MRANNANAENGNILPFIMVMFHSSEQQETNMTSCFRFHPIAALSELPNISVCSCLVKSPNTPTPDEQQTDFRFGATSLKLWIPTRVVWDVERTAAIHHSAVMISAE